MSTIATTNLKHPSSAVNNMVLSSNGNVTAATKFIGAGLDHIVTQSFSSASSINVNNCFSSSYENYKILISITSGTSSNLNMRLRSSGVDSSSSVYSYSSLYSQGTTTSAFNTSAINTSLWLVGYLGNSGTGVTSSFDLFRPSLNVSTTLNGTFTYLQTDSAACVGYYNSMINTATSSYDGFTIYLSSGTMTGNIRIYGYENT